MIINIFIRWKFRILCGFYFPRMVCWISVGFWKLPHSSQHQTPTVLLSLWIWYIISSIITIFNKWSGNTRATYTVHPTPTHNFFFLIKNHESVKFSLDLWFIHRVKCMKQFVFNTKLMTPAVRENCGAYVVPQYLLC